MYTYIITHPQTQILSYKSAKKLTTTYVCSVINCEHHLLFLVVCMAEHPSSPRLCFWPWRSRRRRREDHKRSEKSSGITAGRNAYYGDYGLEENIYDENGFFPMKKQERLVKKAMEEQENAMVKMANKKALNFSTKKK